jgi:shikimate kinase
MSEVAARSMSGASAAMVVAQLGTRSIVLVGMMGAGKSSIGRRLAMELGLPGAFINPQTRALIKARGVSVWLKADLDVLLRRIRRRSDRPLLQTEDPEQALRHLIDARYPIYAESDVTVLSREVSHEAIVVDIVATLVEYLTPRKTP